MSASTDGGAAPDPTAADAPGPSPLRVDPGKGWLITLPVSEEVLGRLGGPAQVGERLRPIFDALPGQAGALTPDASDKLTAAYGELFRHLEAVAQQPGQE
jgi:hypothetical protein